MVHVFYFLISTSYLAGLFDIFIYYFISDRIVCAGVTFYQIRTLNDAYHEEFESH